MKTSFNDKLITQYISSNTIQLQHHEQKWNMKQCSPSSSSSSANDVIILDLIDWLIEISYVCSPWNLLTKTEKKNMNVKTLPHMSLHI